MRGVGSRCRYEEGGNGASVLFCFSSSASAAGSANGLANVVGQC